jgi:hypothetical protein
MDGVGETLGGREAAGRLSSSAAATLEQTLGPGWRGVTVEEARDALAEAFNRNQTLLTATEAWRPFLGALISRLGEGEAMSDALIASVVREVYGDQPTAEQMRVVLEIVENFYGARRDGQLLEPGT